MRVVPYRETRQVSHCDCGGNALVSALVLSPEWKSEDRVARLAQATKSGMDAAGVLHCYGLPMRAGRQRKVSMLRWESDRGFPTLWPLQAYRESSRPYEALGNDGHWVVAIGSDRWRILFEDPSAFHRTWLADDELRERWHGID